MLCNIIQGYNKGTLPFCLRRLRCVNCPKGTGCKYRAFKYSDLIYGEIEKIEEFFKVKGKDQPQTADNILSSVIQDLTI